MRLENGTPADRRPLTTPYTILGVLVGFVGLLAAIVVVGPGRAIDWVVSYLIPMVVLLGVAGLLVREVGKVYDERDKQHSTSFSEVRRGEGRGPPLPHSRPNSVGRGGS